MYKKTELEVKNKNRGENTFYLSNVLVDEVRLRKKPPRQSDDKSLRLLSRILAVWVVDDEDKVWGLVGK